MGIKNATFFIFSRLDLDYFLFFLLERYTIHELDEGEFIFLFLELSRLPCLLVQEVSGFSDTLFTGSSNELAPALLFFALLQYWS